MSMVTGIILTVIFVALFWILHLYAVRRARFLVGQQLRTFPEPDPKEAKTTHAVDTYEPVEIVVLSKNSPASANIESLGAKPKIPEKPPGPPRGKKQWAIPDQVLN